jgi:O-antigen/teichoic acid export membrane protein
VSFVIIDAAPAVDKPAAELVVAGHRDKVMMLAATLARMAVGLGTFILLARFLGPAQYGLIATAIAYSVFVGLATDFGLATYAFREASGAPADAGKVVGTAIGIKAVLTGIAVLVGAPFVFSLMTIEHALILVLAFIGTQAGSFADLAIIVARANIRFDLEAKLVVAISVIWLVIVGAVAALTRDVLAAAAAYCVSRLLYVPASWWVMRRWFKPGAFAPPIRAMRAMFVKARSYAADNILTVVAGQIDVLLFGLLLSAHDIGIYQGGARLVQAIVPFAVVLSTVYLRPLSNAANNEQHDVFRANANRLTLEFSLLAIGAGVGFAVAGPLATQILYGAQYVALETFWTPFGLFAMLRFASAGHGIQLVALGRIKIRVTSQIVSIGLFVLATAIILPRYGLAAAPWLLAFSALPSFLLLSFAIRSEGRSGRYVSISIVAVLALASLISVLGWRAG